jgi:hypothetical protein
MFPEEVRSDSDGVYERVPEKIKQICMKKLFLYFALLMVVVAVYAQPSVQYKNGNLIYLADERGNRLPDYSYCGYGASNREVPVLMPTVAVKAPEGDATQVLQQAIDEMALRVPDKNGHRGVILLKEGTYRVSGSLRIRVSGIVLRGVHPHTTRLIKTGKGREALIYIEGKQNLRYVDTLEVASGYYPVNALQLAVYGSEGLRVGDRVKIVRFSTAAWIKSLGCDEFGGGNSALGWKPGDLDLAWDRTVTGVDAGQIQLHAPLPMVLDSQWGKTVVMPYRWEGRISQCGIEQLSLLSEFDARYPMDEDHSWTGIYADNAEDCWIRQVHLFHFAGFGVALHAGTSQFTVEDCTMRAPVAENGGHRKTGFYTAGQLNLVQRCFTEDMRNDFVAGYGAPGPNAFVQCESRRSIGFSGAVSSWAPGLLFDLVVIDGNNLRLGQLGQHNNGAGWNTANSMLWQCSAAEIECSSPSDDGVNRAYGCWGQYSGDGEWFEADSHIAPRSLFYTQLQERLGRDVACRARLMPLNTNATSSPTVEQAAVLTAEAREPVMTMERWIAAQPLLSTIETIQPQQQPSIRPTKKSRVNKEKLVHIPEFHIKNGQLRFDDRPLTGRKQDVAWWSGKTKPSYLTGNRAKVHITRFVPGHEGYGLTDRIDSVVTQLSRQGVAVLDHNYGLWYERRRDDHQRVRRADGNVWAPFYEQPFARSGQGQAWDGLSKYDLTRPNEWYWNRLGEFAAKAAPKGILLFHQHFFQHNILEAGAHWVDSPWRTANNINNTDFPEPVHFAGDKRIFYAEHFYDTTHLVRKALYRNYIREGLERLSRYPNVVHLISAEYTGPLHFVQFWIDVIREWEQETGNKALIALSTTKDVQDAILADPLRSGIIDIIDIRYWHYRQNDTVYAPSGGQHLAPRQHARLVKTGKTGYQEVYKAVHEYRTKYPDKVVVYFGQSYTEQAEAVKATGGSIPAM